MKHIRVIGGRNSNIDLLADYPDRDDDVPWKNRRAIAQLKDTKGTQRHEYKKPTCNEQDRSTSHRSQYAMDLLHPCRIATTAG